MRTAIAVVVALLGCMAAFFFLSDTLQSAVPTEAVRIASPAPGDVQVHVVRDVKLLYMPHGMELDQNVCDDAFTRLQLFVHREMQKLPDHLVRDVVKQIVVVNSIKRAGQKAAGSYSPDRSIWLCVGDNPSEWYDARTMRHILVHEWSSLVMLAFPREFGEIDRLFREQADDAAHSYLVGDVVEQLGKHPELAVAYKLSTTEVLRAGFISPYAQANVEEDFNELAAYLFLEPEDSGQLAKVYPRLRVKMIAIAKFFYRNSSDFRKSTIGHRIFKELDIAD